MKKDDPEFSNLVEKAGTLKQLSEELNLNTGSPTPQEITILEEGKNSGKIICDYYDKLISCSNPGDYTEWESG